MTIPDAELLLIESKLLALRKIADQGLLLVEQIKKTAQPVPAKTRRPRPRQIKYTAMILGNTRATKKTVTR